MFSAADIARRLDELAVEITARNIPGLLVVPVLKGSFVFAADLIRALHRAGLAPEVDFLTLSSYKKSRTSSGQVAILRDLDLEVEGRNVLHHRRRAGFGPHPRLRQGPDQRPRRQDRS